MNPSSTNVRRVAGGIALLGALVLLIAGETILKPKLEGVGYILYWLACLVLTAVAIGAAFLDVRALRQDTRREHQNLLEDTFKDLPENRRK